MSTKESEFDDGVVTVPGYEAQVHHYTTLKQTIKLLEKGQKGIENPLTLEALEDRFREVAKTAAGAVKRLDFLGKDAKEIVMVLLPDAEKESMRTKLTPEKRQEIARERVQEILGELGSTASLFEEKPAFTLTGQWYDYFVQNILVPNYGVDWEKLELPSGISNDTTVRLSVAGVASLRQVIDHPQATDVQKAAARKLLDLGMQKPTVKVG